jgi:hypothetical protein
MSLPLYSCWAVHLFGQYTNGACLLLGWAIRARPADLVHFSDGGCDSSQQLALLTSSFACGRRVKQSPGCKMLTGLVGSVKGLWQKLAGFCGRGLPVGSSA